MKNINADIGLIGLGVMGSSLALNMESNGFTVAVHNRTTPQIDNLVNNRSQNKKIIGFENLNEFVNSIKKLAIHHHIPLKAELSDLIFSSTDSLGVEAEDEAFGFNDDRLHPDIYMDEILRSLRLMHQVLPAICTKLGITPEELKIDKGDFTL